MHTNILNLIVLNFHNVANIFYCKSRLRLIIPYRYRVKADQIT